MELFGWNKPVPAKFPPDRAEVIAPEPNALTHRSFAAPLRESERTLQLAMGCFWGAERLLWQLEGVTLTAVGYTGGKTINPNYADACSGLSGHTEAVRIAYDPAIISLDDLLRVFWQAHDPTQGDRQGNDVGSQYRSALYFEYAEDEAVIRQSCLQFQRMLDVSGKGEITTEIKAAGVFYFAEAAHQQYLHNNPGGYCGLRGTGVPIY